MSRKTTSTGGYFTVEYPDNLVWSGERNTIKVTRNDVDGASLYKYVTLTFIFGNTTPLGRESNAQTWLPSSGSPAYIEYALDEDGAAEIDLTDLFRTYSVFSEAEIIDGSFLIFHEGAYPNVGEEDSAAISGTYLVAGLINPARLFIPRSNGGDVVANYNGNTAVILPPTRILASTGATLAVEHYGLTPKYGDKIYSVIGYQSAPVEIVQDGTGGGVLSIPATADRGTIFALGDSAASFVTFWLQLFAPLECDHKYAAVRWISATGRQRVATWEVRTHKQGASDTLEVATTDGSFNVAKERTDTLTLYLDTLNVYDLWYYSDILTSGRVEVSTDGGSTWQRVDVVTKEATIQNGEAGPLNTLEISVTFATYDAIIM